MSLFDLDPVVPPPKPARPARPKPAQPAQLEAFAAPYVAAAPRPVPTVDRIGDVAQRIAQHERDGRFRCDAVTHTLVLVLYRQAELALDVADGRLCHPAMTDQELTAAYEDGIACLRSIHGDGLFPDQPVWSADHLRRWTALFHGADLIGRRGPLDCDVIALVFQAAADMTGKQHAWGAFYTPYQVTKLMAELNLGDDGRPWARTVCDPCIGAGSMLVAVCEVVRHKLLALQRDGFVTPSEAAAMAARHARGLAGIDIDREAAWCAAAQLSVRTGYPVMVACGNALGTLLDLRPAVHPHRASPAPDTIAA